MPNGGSDCCGTCWFNARNKGEAGYEHAKDPEPNFCTIRHLPVEDAFYTYCGNHPHRRAERDPIPLGPVFTGDSDGDRRIWKPSPDTEEIRAHLLDLLGCIHQQASEEYPIGVPCDELVIWQLGEFRELRAVALLKEVVGFSARPQYGRFQRTRAPLIAMAEQALKKIDPAYVGRSAAPERKWWQLWK